MDTPAVVIIIDSDTKSVAVDILNYEALGLYDTHGVPFTTEIRAEMFAANLSHLLALPIVRTTDDFATFQRVNLSGGFATIEATCDCGHLSGQHQTGHGAWTGFCAGKLSDLGGEYLYDGADPNEPCACEGPTFADSGRA